MVKLDTQFVLYSSIIYLVLYLKPSNALSHQSDMKSVNSVPILAGYSVKNFSYILYHPDILQESLRLVQRVLISNKSCCLLIAITSHIYCSRQRNHQTPYYVKPLSKD